MDEVYGRPFPRMRLHSSTFNLAKRTQLPRVIPPCYFLIDHHPKRKDGKVEGRPARRKGERRRSEFNRNFAALLDENGKKIAKIMITRAQ